MCIQTESGYMWMWLKMVFKGFGRFCMFFLHVPTGSVLGATNFPHPLSLEESCGYLVYTNLSIILRVSNFSLARLGHPPCPNFETHVNHHNPRRQGVHMNHPASPGSEFTVPVYLSPHVRYDTICHVWGIPFPFPGIWLQSLFTQAKNRLKLYDKTLQTFIHTHMLF